VLRSLHFDGVHLFAELQGTAFSFVRLVFRDVIGFRVLDERDLLEFWPEFSEAAGWLWRVEAGGWLDLERTRATFDTPRFYKDALEHLIVDDKCVSILSQHPPEFFDVGGSPEDA
jgi:hypothetical protein